MQDLKEPILSEIPLDAPLALRSLINIQSLYLHKLDSIRSCLLFAFY